MNEIFINISKIIERDKKTSTYKFALLRGTIEIIQDNSPFIIIKDEVVEMFELVTQQMKKSQLAFKRFNSTSK